MSLDSQGCEELGGSNSSYLKFFVFVHQTLHF